MNAELRPLLVSLALGTLPLTAGAQTVRSDSARLVVTQAGRPIGTEDFALRIGTGSDGSPGASFVATTNGDSESLRVVVAAGARRITIRVASAAGEAAREYPGGSTSLAVDERVLSLFALVARVDPGPITVFGPPPGGRRSASLTEVGQDRFPGAPQPLRHLELRSGADVVDIWLDPQGRLIRVAIPSRELVAERVTQP